MKAGQPCLARRVRRRAAGEADGDGDQGVGVILDQPGLDAPGTYHLLDAVGGQGGRGQERQETGQERPHPQGRPAPHFDQAPRHGTGPASNWPVTEVLFWQHLAGGLHDIGVGDGGDLVRPGLDLVQGKAGRQRGPDELRRPHQPIPGLDGRDLKPPLGRRQLGRGHALGQKQSERGIDRLAQLRHIAADRGNRGQGEAAVVEIAAVVIGVDAGGEALADDEIPIEAAGRAAGQQLGQHVQGIAIARTARVRSLVKANPSRAQGIAFRRRIAIGRRQVSAHPEGLVPARVPQHQLPRGKSGWLHEAIAGRHGPRRDRAVVFLGERPHLLGRDIAGDHQYGVVGRIPASIEIERILAGRASPSHAPSRCTGRR